MLTALLVHVACTLRIFVVAERVTDALYTATEWGAVALVAARVIAGEIMRQHTIAGERILAVTESMRPVGRLVRASHQRWDGRGYPDALAGEEIPLFARIVCACDAYDAMRSRRTYKAPMSPADAVAELQRCSGSQFDPRVVGVLVDVALSAASVAG